MKFAVISERGEGLPIALRLKAEGHAVVFMPGDRSRTGEGFVNQTVQQQQESAFGAIRRVTDKSAILVFTNATQGALAERCRTQGYLTFGASLFHQVLACNPVYQQAVLKLVEIPFLPTGSMIQFALEGWFNGEDFIYPIFGLIPEYGFLVGDIGPPIECAGVTGFAFKTFKPLRFKETIERLRPLLKSVDYKGPISVDILGGAVLRVVCGFRFDFSYLFLGLLDLELGQLITDTIRGLVKQMRVSYNYGICVRATLPPYPHVLAEPKGLVIYDERNPHSELVPTGVRREQEKWFTSSFTGEAFCACAYAPSIKEAQQNVFQILSRAMVPDLQFRLDIGGLALKHISHLLQAETNRGAANDGASRKEPTMEREPMPT